ncbi:hypothetical protein PANDA_000796, partial [Ailuropoda melanoleuca]
TDPSPPQASLCPFVIHSSCPPPPYSHRQAT